VSPQTSIAHYRIIAKLGEGGMGAVYRATDTKLNRDVAIKVLPDSFAADPDRLARFQREAQVLASLNHPNIAAIYGVEDRAIVMELVEGTDLAGPLAVEEALPPFSSSSTPSNTPMTKAWSIAISNPPTSRSPLKGA
jgi:serine/threonine-protein kinase